MYVPYNVMIRKPRLESQTVDYVSRITVDNEDDLVPAMIVSNESDRNVQELSV